MPRHSMSSPVAFASRSELEAAHGALAKGDRGAQDLATRVEKEGSYKAALRRTSGAGRDEDWRMTTMQKEECNRNAGGGAAQLV